MSSKPQWLKIPAMSKRSDDFPGRIRIIAVLFCVIAGILIYRLFDLQVVSANKYREEANRQYSVFNSESSISSRGTIYFREKSNQLVSAAVVKEGYQMVINPSILKNPEDVYDKIFSVIPVDREDFLRRAKKENDIYEIISHRVEQEQADKIRSMNISGLDFTKEDWRFYPAGKLASHVLGFVGYANNSLSRSGQYGIEKFYEDFLKQTSENAARNSFAEAFLGLSRDIFARSLENKQDLVLTIEPSVQGFLETALEKILEKYSAESAGGIIIDPKTGKILAMAAKPDFDPNYYNKVENQNFFLNPLVSSIFEIGSVMKPITISSALDAGKITPETTYYDAGYLIIDKTRIKNYDGKGRGTVDMQAVLDNSLNTGAMFVMRQMGKENFRNYVLNFGFGEKTGIDLPDEIKGNVSSLESPREIEYATASFGQGIAPTPIEFAAAFSALANGGYLVQPYIIDPPAGGQNRPVIKRQVIKKETSEEITRMLVKVVDNALVGGTVKVDRYSIAAKTGTAQIPLENKKGYSEDYLHSFIGYAPAFDAKFLTFLYLKRPKAANFASNTLTQPFMDITKFLLNYYQVPPDR